MQLDANVSMLATALAALCMLLRQEQVVHIYGRECANNMSARCRRRDAVPHEAFRLLQRVGVITAIREPCKLDPQIRMRCETSVIAACTRVRAPMRHLSCIKSSLRYLNFHGHCVMRAIA